VLRVGLTGGIACGKSHVLRRLAHRGFETIDLDAVSRRVTAPGSPALREIAEAFGPSVLDQDGSLDRARLGAIVFADAGARARLDAIVHPRIRAEEARWASALGGRPDAVLVTDAALLVEAGAHLRFDRLVVVHCDPESQLVRLRERDGLDERSARARIDAQMPIAEKRAFAHLEVDTSGSVADTDRAADALASAIVDLAATRVEPSAIGADALVGGVLHGPRSGPRGLTPLALLEAAAEAGGLEMETLARRLAPPATRPWYRTAEEAAPGAPAASLAVALAAWTLFRRGPDPPFLAAAAGSVARLTHADPAERADACLLALVAQETAVAGGSAGNVEAAAARLTALARRFGGAPPSGALAAVWSSVRLHVADPAGARAECARRGGEASLAAALAGIGARIGEMPDAARWRRALDGLRSAER
jgi:dephospho-CoA kinase